MCLFCRHICYYRSLQGHAAVYRSSFDFAGVLPLQKGLSLLKSWSQLCLSPNISVPPLSEEVMGWAAEGTSHRWNGLPSGMSSHRMPLICAMKARTQLFLFMSSCICWEVSLDFSQRLCELHFGIYKATSLMHVFMWQAMGIHCTSQWRSLIFESIKSCWSHANPLKCCLDWSNTHREPDGPEVIVCILIQLWQLVLSREAFFRWGHGDLQ